MKKILSAVPWSVVLVLCLTIGLAPFNPPHIVEKLALLSRGELKNLIDWIDLALHGAPWLLLAAKALFGRGAAP